MKLLSTKEAAVIIAERTGKPISVRQVQHEIKNGYIKAQRIGNLQYAIYESDLQNYVRRKTGSQPK